MRPTVPIGAAVDQLLHERGMEDALVLGRVTSCWEEVVGPEVARQVHPQLGSRPRARRLGRPPCLGDRARAGRFRGAQPPRRTARRRGPATPQRSCGARLAQVDWKHRREPYPHRSKVHLRPGSLAIVGRSRPWAWTAVRKMTPDRPDGLDDKKEHNNVVSMPVTPASYEAEDITVLEGLEPVRLRPGMFIGSTGPTGLHHLIWEVVDNSVDEAMAGYCTRIDVTLLADGGCRVVDNGRGIPVDPIPGYPDKTAAEVVLTVLHAGGKFGGSGYKVSGGLHGVGVSVVNALSTRLVLEIDRGGNRHRMEFVDGGKPNGPLQVVGPCAAGPDRHHGHLLAGPDDLRRDRVPGPDRARAPAGDGVSEPGPRDPLQGRAPRARRPRRPTATPAASSTSSGT